MNYLAFLFLLVSMSINAQFQNYPERANDIELDYFVKSQIDLEEVGKRVLNDKNCHLSLKNYKGCVAAILVLTRMQSRPFVILPELKDFDKNIRKYMVEGSISSPAFSIGFYDKSYFDSYLSKKTITIENTKLRKRLISIWEDHYNAGKAYSLEILFDFIKKTVKVSSLKAEVAMSKAAIEAYLNQVYSSYNYLSSREYYFDSIKRNNNIYTDIGLKLIDVKKGLYVESVYESSLAMKSGIKEHDIISRIDGEKLRRVLKKLSYEQKNNLLSKNFGDVHELKVIRKNKKIKLNIKIGHTIVRNVTSRFDKTNNTLYLKLKSFADKSAAEKIKNEIISNLKVNKKIQNIIFDLRDNSGGYLKSAVEIADLFLPKGKEVTFIQSIKDESSEVLSLETKSNKYFDITLTLLVNHRSASASELLAQALVYHKRAFLVGTKTYGKGSVQRASSYNEFFNSSNEVTKNIQVNLTKALFFAPDGSSNNYYGITPHFVVKNPENIKSEEAIRLADSSINPVIDKYTKPIVFVADQKIKTCLLDKKDNRSRYKDYKSHKNLDFQYLFALDLNNCL